LKRLERYAYRFVEFEEEIEKRFSYSNAPDAEVVEELRGMLIELKDGFDRDLTPFGDPLRTLSGGKGRAFLGGVWRGISGHVISRVINGVAEYLGITGWSFGVTAGMPSGISSTITIHFARIK